MDNRRAAGTFWRSPGVKFFGLGILAVILLVPTFFVWLLLFDRKERADNVADEIASQWGEAQRIVGPFLIVPYEIRTTVTRNGIEEARLATRYAVLLPDEAAFDGTAQAMVRYRSIYETTLYTVELGVRARFAAPGEAQFTGDVARIDWSRGRVVLMLSDLRGLRAATLEAAGRNPSIEPGLGVGVQPDESIDALVEAATRSPSLEPGLGVGALSGEGIHAMLDLDAVGMDSGRPLETVWTVELRGSGSLRFAPVGRETRVALAADWPHPSFDGAFLPVSREVAAGGFTAEWSVPHLARSVPQSWTIGDSGNSRATLDRFRGSQFGVLFYEPINFYNLVDRALKYAIMFLGAVLLVVFAVEVLSGARIHLVQYCLVGLTFILFYVLLLALAEHIGFDLAYLVASVATVGVLSAYMALVVPERSRALVAFVCFSALFALLYMILSLEDYALLAGATVGFVLMSALLFATRNVDWTGAATVRPATGD